MTISSNPRLIVHSTDNGTVLAVTADATLNLIVWGFVALAIIVILLEYARHRGDK